MSTDCVAMLSADEFEFNNITYKNTERNVEEKGAMTSFVVRFDICIYKTERRIIDHILVYFRTLRTVVSPSLSSATARTPTASWRAG